MAAVRVPRRLGVSCENPATVTEATPTRAVALELMDERRAMREGYVFLDEKCLLLAGAIMAELARYQTLARALAAAHDAATDALRAAVGRHGLEGLAVYPAAAQGDARLDVQRRSVMGVPLQDAAWQPAPASPPAAAHPTPRRVGRRVRLGRHVHAGSASAASAAASAAGEDVHRLLRLR